MIIAKRVQTYDILDHGVVVAILHVLTVPVNLTTGPINGTLSIASLAGRPQTELNSRRGLRVVVLASGLVVSLVAVQGTKDLAINLPAKGVRCPVDGVSVPLRVSVGCGKVLLITVYNNISRGSQSSTSA